MQLLNNTVKISQNSDEYELEYIKDKVNSLRSVIKNIHVFNDIRDYNYEIEFNLVKYKDITFRISRRVNNDCSGSVRDTPKYTLVMYIGVYGELPKLHYYFEDGKIKSIPLNQYYKIEFDTLPELIKHLNQL